MTGDRHYQNRAAVFTALDALRADKGDLLVIEGSAPGADTFAKQWAETNRSAYADFPAHWNRFRGGAGPIRNEQMLAEMTPDVVYGFHDAIERSKGTKGMLELAKEAGVPAVLNPHLGGGHAAPT